MATDLNTTILALQIDQGVKFVNVKFHKENGDFDLNGAIDDNSDSTGIWSAQNYTYKVDPELYATLKEGALVVVQARNHFQVVKIVDMDVEIDFGNRSLIERLRWVIADVSSRLDIIRDLQSRERKAKKQITNARLRKESQEILAAANLTSADVQLITGRDIDGDGMVIQAGKMSAEPAPE